MIEIINQMSSFHLGQNSHAFDSHSYLIGFKICRWRLLLTAEQTTAIIGFFLFLPLKVEFQLSKKQNLEIDIDSSNTLSKGELGRV